MIVYQTPRREFEPPNVAMAFLPAIVASKPSDVSVNDFIGWFDEPSTEEDFIALMDGEPLLLEGEFAQRSGISVEHLLQRRRNSTNAIR